MSRTLETETGHCWIGAVAADFDARDFLDKKEAARLDRSAHFFVSSAVMAAEAAELTPTPVNPTRVGVFEGTSLGGIASLIAEIRRFDRGVRPNNRPRALSTAMTGAAGSHVARRLGIQGPVVAISCGSVSTGAAISAAYDQLRLGAIDIALVGGGEAPLIDPILGLFSRVGLLAAPCDRPERACRPFDALRNGTVLAEGGSAIVLERLAHASRRGAPIHGEIRGVGTTNDADGRVAPSLDSRPRAASMLLALDRAGAARGDIDYISAHATATVSNDRAETAAIKQAFGADAYQIPIGSPKSVLGHALGTCATLEAVATVIAMQGGFIPPTLNLENPDPQCDLDYVPRHARPGTIDLALRHNASFGGRNNSIVLRRWSEDYSVDGREGHSMRGRALG